MPVHIDEMHTEVNVLDGELPLSPAQIEKLVRIILQRLEENQRRLDQNRRASQIRNSAIPKEQQG